MFLVGLACRRKREYGMRLCVTLLDIRDPDIALEALTVDDRGENRDLVIFVAAVNSGQVKRKNVHNFPCRGEYHFLYFFP